jgi:hypothetical protein
MLSYCIWKAIQRAIKGAGASWGKLERTAERARAGRIVWVERASRVLAMASSPSWTFNPLEKEPLRAQTVMFHPQNIPHLLEQPFGLARGNGRRYHWRRHAPGRSD